MKLVKLSNKEIEKLGGTYVKDTGWEYNDHYNGYLKHRVYLLDGEEVISFNTWEFKGV
ncbi:hypothetical protein [Fusobacterium necrophorum]|uniref:hypothetical protein n=1 Tax=Fusobacterium necrophorum TaxID=859 RepID=UPI000A4B2F25|nr:hypothetical protein [Fusobacterium necrophorum]